MKTRDFYFELPDELIAQQPVGRGESRLLVYSRDRRRIRHEHIGDLPDHLSRDTLVVVNNSRVRRARVYAQSSAGLQVEFLFLYALDDSFSALEPGLPSRYWKVMVSKAKRQIVGRKYHLPTGVTGEIVEVDALLRVLQLDRAITEDYFDSSGHIPLPPYIRRQDSAADTKQYQTIFASKLGSVAAPTAGLHISHSLLGQLRQKGIHCCEVTLHVGLGTFLPVRAEEVAEHEMHREDYEIDRETARQITEHHRRGLPILAVGTTSLRTLEAAWNAETQSIMPGRASTDLFIYPGYTFKVVDALFTNFHTPQSSLLMLVSAFVGREEILAVYREAITQHYRFFSYGDACLLL